MVVVSQWKDVFQAAEHKDLEAVKSFVENREDVLNSTNEIGETVALIAARNYDFPTLKYALEKDNSMLLHSDNSGGNIIEAAIDHGASYSVKYLVENQNWDIHRGNEHRSGNTPIHHAAKKGQLEILKYFLEEQQGDVNVRNGLGNSPLFVAAEMSHMKLIKYLTEERNADLKVTNVDNENVLFDATRRADLEVMRYILDERKAPLDINWVNNSHHTILFIATKAVRRDDRMRRIIQYLVEQKRADVNIPDDQKRSPLHIAAFENNYSLCQFLVAYGANPWATDKYNYTAAENANLEPLVGYFKELRSARNPRSVTHFTEDKLPARWMALDGVQLENFNWKETNVAMNATRDEFNNFLTVAFTILRYFNKFSSVRQRAFLSPPEIALSRVNPVAIDAINIAP